MDHIKTSTTPKTFLLDRKVVVQQTIGQLGMLLATKYRRRCLI